MEPHDGYFCRAYIGQDVQANVIARTLREAEQEITRMIRGGAMSAHAVCLLQSAVGLEQTQAVRANAGYQEPQRTSVETARFPAVLTLEHRSRNSFLETGRRQ